MVTVMVMVMVMAILEKVPNVSGSDGCKGSQNECNHGEEGEGNAFIERQQEKQYSCECKNKYNDVGILSLPVMRWG